MIKQNHGIANYTKFVENRNKYFHKKKTKPVLGGVFFLPQVVLAMEYEGDLPEFLPFMVTKIYSHVILIQRRTRKRGIHTQAISKWNFRHYAEKVNEDGYMKMVNQFWGISVNI